MPDEVACHVQPRILLNIFTVNEKKGDLFLPFTVGTPTTAAQPPFQPQYVFDYVLFTNISASHTCMCSDFTFGVSRCMHCVYVYIHDVHV